MALTKQRLKTSAVLYSRYNKYILYLYVDKNNNIEYNKNVIFLKSNELGKWIFICRWMIIEMLNIIRKTVHRKYEYDYEAQLTN